MCNVGLIPLISDASALFDVAPGMVSFNFILLLLFLIFLKVTDKTGARSARAKTATTKIPMPIISTVSMPFDEISHLNGARQQNSHTTDFQDSQRFATRAVMNLNLFQGQQFISAQQQALGHIVKTSHCGNKKFALLDHKQYDQVVRP
jgi:hypothetical protein